MSDGVITLKSLGYTRPTEPSKQTNIKEKTNTKEWDDSKWEKKMTHSHFKTLKTN